MKRKEQVISSDLTDYTPNGNKGVKTTKFTVPNLEKYSGPIVGTGTEVAAEDDEITKAIS